MEKTKKVSKVFASVAKPPRPHRILLADDSKSIREVVSESLEFIGYEVALAINGIEALTAFLENSFDLVMTDLEMPVMDGLCLAGHIKAKSPSTPVILLTGTDRDAVSNIKKDLVDSFLFKPFSLEDLQGVLQRAFAPRKIKHGGFGGKGRPGAALKN